MTSGRDDRPRIGISRCLLGDEVRYDGGHKYDASLLDAFGARVEWVQVCPEVEVGMGVPREPIQLVAGTIAVVSGSQPVRLVGVQTGTDWTGPMTVWSRERLDQLASMNLSGFVLKARSPSCGLHSVPIHAPDAASGYGRGLFAAALIERFPDLPVEDEEALRAAAVRSAFLARVIAYQRSG